MNTERRHRQPSASPDLALAAARERPDVAAEVHCLRSGLGRERRQLAAGRSVANHEAAAPMAQPGIEFGQALEQELRARARGVASAQQSVVEAEHWHHCVPRIQRRAQGRVVVQTKVATEPDQRGHGASPNGGHNGVVRSTSLVAEHVLERRRDVRVAEGVPRSRSLAGIARWPVVTISAISP